MTLVSQLHLMRLGGPDRNRYEPISKAEWRAAVEATSGVRITQGGERAPNLKTGTVASLWRQLPCDAEVALLGAGGDPTWVPLFSWQDSGSAIINRVFDPTDSSDPITVALFTLAEALDASIADDAGEVLTPPG
jgi:hypothetical protein